MLQYSEGTGYSNKLLCYMALGLEETFICTHHRIYFDTASNSINLGSFGFGTENVITCTV